MHSTVLLGCDARRMHFGNLQELLTWSLFANTSSTIGLARMCSSVFLSIMLLVYSVFSHEPFACTPSCRVPISAVFRLAQQKTKVVCDRPAKALFWWFSLGQSHQETLYGRPIKESRLNVTIRWCLSDGRFYIWPSFISLSRFLSDRHNHFLLGLQRQKKHPR